MYTNSMVGKSSLMNTASIQNQSLALLTDFYQISMAYAYWRAGIDKKQACFHLFFRRPPFHGGFTVAAGLESVIRMIESFHFSEDDLAYLASIKHPDGTPYFDRLFLEMLSKLELEISVDAVPEGTVVFPYEPLLRVVGPLMQCQLLESCLLNLINFPTLIATKAARVFLAADGDQIMEFGLRRAQGIDGALTASRAAYIGGCGITSNVMAAKAFGIPIQGTQAHSWVMAFEQEEIAFETYAEVLPDACVFLVDTYDTVTGIQNAIAVGQKLRLKGKELKGIRLDSGDLAQLSIIARGLLDAAGFHSTQIIASNELDEIVISELKRQGAKIDVWGVGTNLVTGGQQAALDGVYKLSAIHNDAGEWTYTLKLSEQLSKVSNPGVLQVRRFHENGINIGDIIYDALTGIQESVVSIDPFDPTKRHTYEGKYQHEDLLIPIFDRGKRVYAMPSLPEIQKRTKAEISKLPIGMKRFLNPQLYFVGMEERLYEIKSDLVTAIRMRCT